VSKNKFSNYVIELPLELRWRTSTPTAFNFLRIYLGFKLGYVFYNSTTYRGDDGTEKLSNIDGYEKILFYNNEYYDVVKDEYKLVKFYGNNYYLVKINDYEERLFNNKWYIFNKLNKLERKRT